jgi:DNA-binding LacI/PurR family transcriptional regulator
MTTFLADSAPTLDDVAAVAGVSRATASRVINGAPEVAGPTRHRVHQAVRQLGYVPNHAARTLAGRRAAAVGLVVAAAGLPDDFVAGVLRGSVTALHDEELDCVMFTVARDSDWSRVAGSVRTGRVAGVLLVLAAGAPAAPPLAVARDLPTVVVRPTPESSDAEARGAAAARLLAEHFVTPFRSAM